MLSSLSCTVSEVKLKVGGKLQCNNQIMLKTANSASSCQIFATKEKIEQNLFIFKSYCSAIYSNMYSILFFIITQLFF